MCFLEKSHLFYRLSVIWSRRLLQFLGTSVIRRSYLFIHVCKKRSLYTVLLLSWLNDLINATLRLSLYLLTAWYILPLRTNDLRLFLNVHTNIFLRYVGLLGITWKWNIKLLANNCNCSTSQNGMWWNLWLFV